MDLMNKPANRKRPTWAQSEREFNLHFASSRHARRWMMARMYWLENKTATQIAKYFSVSVHSVEVCLQRMFTK